MKERHTDIVTAKMGLDYSNDTLIAYFSKVKNSRLKQTSLNLFFKQSPTDEPVTVIL